VTIDEINARLLNRQKSIRQRAVDDVQDLNKSRIETVEGHWANKTMETYSRSTMLNRWGEARREEVDSGSGGGGLFSGWFRTKKDNTGSGRRPGKSTDARGEGAGVIRSKVAAKKWQNIRKKSQYGAIAAATEFMGVGERNPEVKLPEIDKGLTNYYSVHLQPSTARLRTGARLMGVLISIGCNVGLPIAMFLDAKLNSKTPDGKRAVPQGPEVLLQCPAHGESGMTLAMVKFTTGIIFSLVLLSITFSSVNAKTKFMVEWLVTKDICWEAVDGRAKEEDTTKNDDAEMAEYTTGKLKSRKFTIDRYKTRLADFIFALGVVCNMFASMMTPVLFMYLSLAKLYTGSGGFEVNDQFDVNTIFL